MASLANVYVISNAYLKDIVIVESNSALLFYVNL